ncbi:hypothetical protein V425_10825 [Lactococcus lactis RTB018]|nr:hypothetical protein [Lactococcus lactis]OAZ15943.1 hypothetical protein V425_10825 [Lactococcus lactis RTB018]
MSNLFVVLLLIAIGFMIYFFIKRKWKFGIIALVIAFACYMIVGLLPSNNQHKEKEITQSSTKTSKSLSKTEKSSSEDSSAVSKSSEVKKVNNSFDLTNNGEYQFTDANIKPTTAKIKNNVISFYFDWRNDDGVADKRSFLGSGVVVVLYQNGKELNQKSSDLSGEKQKISKNTSLEINYDYDLIDNSPVTVKMVPLDGDPKEFVINI